jgi:hypothetical protein
MEVQRMIAATEKTVMNSEYPNAEPKSVFVKAVDIVLELRRTILLLDAQRDS